MHGAARKSMSASPILTSIVSKLDRGVSHLTQFVPTRSYGVSKSKSFCAVRSRIEGRSASTGSNVAAVKRADAPAPLRKLLRSRLLDALNGAPGYTGQERRKVSTKEVSRKNESEDSLNSDEPTRHLEVKRNLDVLLVFGPIKSSQYQRGLGASSCNE